MSTVAYRRVLVATLAYAGVMLFAWAAPTFNEDIDALAARLPMAPREAMVGLERLQASHEPLSSAHQALMYEHTGLAKFYARDYAGVIADGRALQALGKRSADKNAQCMGLLLQAYGHWKLGSIRAAYDLVRQAGQFSPGTVRPEVRIKTLLATAQLKSEEQQNEAALHTVEQALRLADAAGDNAQQFMATNTQALVALAAGDLPLALGAVDRLLELGRHSPYRECLVRALEREVEVSSAAGLTARANAAAVARVALMQALHLDEALGGALLDHADLSTKGRRYAEAESLSAQALLLAPVLADGQLSDRAHFSHAIANIHAGRITQGEAEVALLFATDGEHGTLAAYLPDYIAALTEAGAVNASVKAESLHKRIESDAALHRAKEMEAVRNQLLTLANKSALKTREASDAHRQQMLWLAVAVSALAAMFAIAYFFGRARMGNRLLTASNRLLFSSSNRDALTGLFNRRYLLQHLETMPGQSVSGSAKLSDDKGLVLMIDIDHFKRLNDTHGHAVGDQVLQATASRLAALFRNDDILIRWGGEEFLALLPASSIGDASGIAARVLAAVAATPVALSDVTVRVTISVGICALKLAPSDRALTWDEVVDLADQALYLAKEGGRNRAVAITGAAGLSAKELSQELREHHRQGKLALTEVKGEPCTLS